MQKGFATLEIILVTIIIAVLVKIAVPKAAQIIDTVSLDYEQKRFYSELRYVQAMGRSAELLETGTGKTNLTITSEYKPENPILLIDTAENYYQVFRSKECKKALREPHYLSNGSKIRLKDHEKENFLTIKFDGEGKMQVEYESTSISSSKATLNSGSIILTSRLGKSKYIVFDSVGRIKAEKEN